MLNRGVTFYLGPATFQTYFSYHSDIWFVVPDCFLCQLTCQSADIMASLCGVDVRVSDFSSKTTRPRDMLFFFKDSLST